MLPRYSDADRETFICNFEKKYSALFQIVEKNASLSKLVEQQIIMDHEAKDQKTCTIPVEYFSVDFRALVLNTKITSQWIAPAEVHNDPFYALDLCKVLTSIHAKYPQDIDKFDSIRNIIDSMFQKTRQTFLVECFLFMTFYYLPLLSQIFYFTHNKTSSTGILVCNISCFITNMAFFALETIQMRYDGLKEYFKSFFNKMDTLVFFMYNVYFIFRIKD